MCFGSTVVTQDLATKPACLTAKGTFHDIPGLGNQTITLYLPRSQRFVLQGFILNAIFDTARFQGFTMFLTTVSFVRMNTDVRFDICFIQQGCQRFAVMAVSSRGFNRYYPNKTPVCI